MTDLSLADLTDTELQNLLDAVYGERWRRFRVQREAERAERLTRGLPAEPEPHRFTDEELERYRSRIERTGGPVRRNGRHPDVVYDTTGEAVGLR